ncbi:hypothetical protein Droror1_Dr00021303 [Drosera rotundifolia]
MKLHLLLLCLIVCVASASSILALCHDAERSALQHFKQGLCGSPLSKKCGNHEVLAPPHDSSVKEDEGSADVIGWVIRCMGYISGLVVGLVLGRMITDENHDWFVETFGRRQHKKKKNRAAISGFIPVRARPHADPSSAACAASREPFRCEVRDVGFVALRVRFQAGRRVSSAWRR